MSRITADYGRGSQLVRIGSSNITLGCGPADVAGPTPTDLLIAALAACMASEGRRYLEGRGLARDVKVVCDFEMDDRCPGLIARIQYRVVIPGELPSGRREGLVHVLESRAIHNPLHVAPEVRVVLSEGDTELPAPTSPREDVHAMLA